MFSGQTIQNPSILLHAIQISNNQVFRKDNLDFSDHFRSFRSKEVLLSRHSSIQIILLRSRFIQIISIISTNKSSEQTAYNLYRSFRSKESLIQQTFHSPLSRSFRSSLIQQTIQIILIKSFQTTKSRSSRPRHLDQTSLVNR